MTKPLLDLPGLLPSWTLALRAERKSPATVKTYSDGVNTFMRWCESTNTAAELTKATVQAFVAGLLDKGAQPKTESHACWLCASSRNGLCRRANSILMPSPE